MDEDSEHLRIGLYTVSRGSCNLLLNDQVDCYQVLFPERTSYDNVSVENEKQTNGASVLGPLKCSQNLLFLLRSL